MKRYIATILYVDGFISECKKPAKDFARLQSAKNWLNNNGTANSINVVIDTKIMEVVYHN